MSDSTKPNNETQEENTALEDISDEYLSDPFKILIGTILSQRTRDENTRKAAKQLFSVFSNASELAEGEINTIEKLIKPAGFYRVKARRIKDVANIITTHYNGKVPDQIDLLLELPSVGRKTANCVLVYGFNKPAIPVDTHVHRISNRLGLVNTKKPEETEIILQKTIDKKFWLEINELFVKFGQKICRSIKSKCDICKLRENCSHYEQNKK